MNSSILNCFKFFVKIETLAECSAREEVVSSWLLAVNSVALQFDTLMITRLWTS